MTSLIAAQAVAATGALGEDALRTVLAAGLEGKFRGQRVLALIPDRTRSLPLPALFRLIVELLHDARQLDFMVALGTHPALSDESLNQLVGISAEQRATTCRHIGLLNHAWDDPDALVSLGVMEDDEIRQIAGPSWHASLPTQVDIRINKAVLEYDHILIVGPTFPHELGALACVVGTIGVKRTPVRDMIHAAARRVPTPITLAALVVQGHDLAGVFVGDLFAAWEAAADLSSRLHIQWCDRPFQRVLSRAPLMYDELWTAGKAMYKMEPAVALGGEVVIYAPHLDVVSHVHGKYIYEVGYHILPYFLADWERLCHVPLGVLAHSTHVRGSGVMEGGIERPNVKVTLASKISPEDCARLNLGYLDPASIDLAEWQGREDEGILYVPKAGEILYRLAR
jgi:nickel-dependent lactate racemase